MIVRTETVDVPGPDGAIRTLVALPGSGTGPWPAVLFFSDIFQNTGPHVRLARRLAGYGFVVLSPELYGRFEPPGTVLDFERDRERALSNADKVRVEHVDADRRALIEHALARPDVDGSRLCAAGFCFGGHLA